MPRITKVITLNGSNIAERIGCTKKGIPNRLAFTQTVFERHKKLSTRTFKSNPPEGGSCGNDLPQLIMTGQKKGENMEKYDYMSAVKNDVREYIEGHDLIGKYRGRRDELEQMLNDDLWIEDSVTGNGS